MAIVVQEKRCGCCRILFGLAAESLIITLTILHVLLSALELLIHLEVVQVPKDSSDTTAHAAAVPITTVSPNATTKSSPYDPGGSAECDIVPSHHSLDITVHVTQYATLAISALFFVEMLSKIAYLQKKFLKDLWQVFDLLVVLCSLGIEIAFFVLHEKLVCNTHPAVEVATFITILRLWRIPRACNENIMRVSNRLDPDEAQSYWAPRLDPNCLQRKLQYKTRMDDEIRYLRQTKAEADTQCTHLGEVIQKQEKQLDKLRKQLNLLDGGVYTGDDQTDIGVVSNGKTYPNGGLMRSAVSVLSGEEVGEVIAQDGGEADPVVKDSATVAFTADTGGKPSQNDLSRKDSDLNSKANDSGIDAKDSFRSDIENNGYVRGYNKSNDEVFADSDGSETPVTGHKTIQQVQVQIEEPSRQKQLPSLTRSTDGSSEDQVVLRRKPSDHFVPYFENAAYDADGDDEDELNATYRSADGVPMTEL